MLERHADSDFYGPISGTFVSPSNEIYDFLSQGFSREEIANKLGILDDNFLEGDLIRIDIDQSLARELDFRNPTGQEEGANKLYAPGGKTSGNVSENIVERIPKDEVRVKVTKIEK